MCVCVYKTQLTLCVCVCVCVYKTQLTLCVCVCNTQLTLCKTQLTLCVCMCKTQITLCVCVCKTQLTVCVCKTQLTLCVCVCVCVCVYKTQLILCACVCVRCGFPHWSEQFCDTGWLSFIWHYLPEAPLDPTGWGSALQGCVPHPTGDSGTSSGCHLCSWWAGYRSEVHTEVPRGNPLLGFIWFARGLTELRETHSSLSLVVKTWCDSDGRDTQGEVRGKAQGSRPLGTHSPCISTCSQKLSEPHRFGAFTEASLQRHNWLNLLLLLTEGPPAPLSAPEFTVLGCKVPALKSQGWFSCQPAPSLGAVPKSPHSHKKIIWGF